MALTEDQTRVLWLYALTVKELREQLAALPPEAGGWLVVLARDAEGNDFSPCAEIDRGTYAPLQTWYGDYLSAQVDEEPAAYPEQTQSSEDESEDGPPNAVCLWPVN